MSLFNRTASLTIGTEKKAIEITGLRFTFSIEKGATESPNKCTCNIYNLKPESRALVENVNNVLILKAGYVDDAGLVTIFTGTVSRALTKREGADWVTELEMMDSGLEYRDTKASLSFAPGVKARQVLNSIAASFNLPIKPLPTEIAEKSYPDGFAFVGRSRDAMNKACQFLGLEWSLQNREVQILLKGKPLSQQAFLLSPDTGLIGSPESESKTLTEKAAGKKGITEKQKGVKVTYGEDTPGGTKTRKLEVQGYKVTSLLQPTINPGTYVKIESKSIKGEFFRVENVVHEGDTHGQPWFSVLTLRYV